MARRADWVFLDRDGTINRKAPEGEYVTRPEELRLLPGAAHAVGRLNRAGVWTAIVTNQRGIARGCMTLRDFEQVQAALERELAREGAWVDRTYLCPHEAATCECRKPAPGMLLRARREVPGLDLARAAIVGDSASDVQAGRRAGALTVLLSPSGDGGAGAGADHVCSSLAEAVSWLLERDGAGR